jgi:hypothetical protein
MKFAFPKMPILPMAKKAEEDDAPKKPKAAANLLKGMMLDMRAGEVSRYFSASVIEKAVQSFDKSALIIIGVSWFVAMASIGLAFIGVKEAAAVKIKVDTARALEPILPKINRILLGKDQYDPLVARLKKQFPDVLFDVTGKPSLRIYSNKPEEFIGWLNAVSYTDSMVPSVRWSLVNLCVGTECPGDFVMSAEVVAEAINIAQPEGKI